MSTKIFTTYNFQGNAIENIAAPVATTDAVNKSYVDTKVSASQQGLDVKVSVYVATTENITIPSSSSKVASLTIDGETIDSNLAGKRILVKEQTAKSENGIYEVKADAGEIYLQRTADASQDTLTANAFTFVEKGTNLHDTGWVLSTNDPITVGTTELVWTQFSSAGVFTFGNGLTKSNNNEVSVNLAANSGLEFSTGQLQINLDSNSSLQLGVGGLSVDLDTNSGLQSGANGLSVDLDTNSGLQLDAGGLSVDLDTNSGLQAGENGLSVDLDSNSGLQLGANGLSVDLKTGSGLATDVDGLYIDNVAITQGGTGATTAAQGLLNLGGVGKHSVTLSDPSVSVGGEGKEFTITHALAVSGTEDVTVSVKELSTSQLVVTDVIILSATTVKVVFGSAPTASNFRVTIIG